VLPKILNHSFLSHAFKKNKPLIRHYHKLNSTNEYQTSCYKDYNRIPIPVMTIYDEQSRINVKQVSKTSVKSAIPFSIAVFLTAVLPVSTPELLTNMLFAGLASMSAQPLVTTKTVSQNEIREDSSISMSIIPFIKKDTVSFTLNFLDVLQKKSATNGLIPYAARNAYGKTATLFGYSLLKPLVDTQFPFVPELIRSFSAGLIGGAVISPVTALLEWSTTLQSSHPNLSYKEQGNYMKEHLQNSSKKPVISVAKRSSLFDGVFNSLQDLYAVPFGVASFNIFVIS
jgi:hypothetical protein